MQFKNWHASELFSMLYKEKAKDPLLHRGTLPCSLNICPAMDKI